MLMKLMKHEFKYSLKVFLPIYLVYIALSVCLRVMNFIAENEIDKFSESLSLPYSMLYVMMIVGFSLSVFALVMIAVFGNIIRYHKNLYTDEGYLMNTLPAKSWSHIVCKLTSGFLWYAITCVIIMLGCTIAFSEIWEVFGEIDELIVDMLKDEPFEAIMSFISSVVSYGAFLLLCYMCEGLRSKMGVNSFVSIVLAIGFLILNSIVITFLTALLTYATDSFSYSSINIFKIVYYFIISILLFAITNWLLKNRLNLE